MSPELRALVRSFRVVAVLGAHDDGSRPASYVPDALHRAGVRILPVNPRLVGARLWGEPVVAALTELTMPCDCVDVFRRATDLPGHLDELLLMTPRPRVVWLQSGIRHDGVAASLRTAGITVVQDRCLMVDHRAAWAT